MTFNSKLSRELTSRFTELTYIQKTIYDYKWMPWEKTIIRSWVVMLYSHWEWFIISSWEQIKNELKSLRILISKCKWDIIKENFFWEKLSLTTCIRISVFRFLFSNSLYIHELPFKFISEDNLKYSLFKNYFITKLCINITEFESIFDSLIKASSTFPTEFLDKWKVFLILKLENNSVIKSSFVNYDDMFMNAIKILLHYRNNISHWKKDLSIEVDEYDYIYEVIKTMLISYKDILIEYFDKELFLE
jgi:hypothetical protein